jgi:2-oxoglutarate ferredoxin oxidoreductase subunit gamma
MISRPVEVRFAGQGGQGLVTLGAIVAEAGARCGLEVAASQSYGSSARGGAACADVVLSPEPIDFPHVIEAEWLIALAQEGYDRYATTVKNGGTILFDSFFVQVSDRADVRQYPLAGTQAAIEKAGNQLAANFIMLGGFVGISKVVAVDAVEATINALVSVRYRSLNARAFAIGLELAKQDRW